MNAAQVLLRDFNCRDPPMKLSWPLILWGIHLTAAASRLRLRCQSRHTRRTEGRTS